MYLGQRSIGLGKCTGSLCMTLTKVTAVALIYKKCCLHNQVRITHQVTTKLGRHILLLLLITWLNFGGIVSQNVECAFRGQTFYWPCMWNGRSDWRKTKRKCISWTRVTLNFAKLNFDIAVIQELLVWLMGNEYANHVVLLLDHTHDLGVEFSRSKFEIALPQEVVNQHGTKWCKSIIRDHDIDFKSMVRWVDIREWGDFRHRRAIDASSFWYGRKVPPTCIYDLGRRISATDLPTFHQSSHETTLAVINFITLS